MLGGLRTCTLDEIKKEPWRLQIQADIATEQLRSLVLKNYHVFIQSNQCANIVKADLTEVQKQTEAITVAIPELKLFCTQMQQEMTTIVAKHSDIQFVFDHYMELIELLEIPQLLEACIHNEVFDGALDVIQFAKETFYDGHQRQRTKEISHCKSSTNFVIHALIREVTQMLPLLREKLLQKLREDLPLALCVRIVGYLRRLDGMTLAMTQDGQSIHSSEYELQLKEEFLNCRSTWLASLTRSLSTVDAYQYTIQLIDIKRTSWFDMITQYSAIFGSENIEGKVDPPLCRWATTTVAEFIQTLLKKLPQIDDFSSLGTVLEQSLFFGGSLGRVGVDFRAILVVYFEDHIFDLMALNWRNACREFQESLSGHSLSSTAGNNNSTPIVLTTYRAALQNSSSAIPFSAHSSTSNSVSNNEDYTPPRVLMSFPILAEFTNALLSSLNELRLCNIVSLQYRLARRLFRTLETLLHTISSFCHENKLKLATTTSENSTSEPNRPRPSKSVVLTESIRDMNAVIASDMLPYIIRCFQRLFPSQMNTRNVIPTTLSLNALIQFMHDEGLLVPV